MTAPSWTGPRLHGLRVLGRLGSADVKARLSDLTVTPSAAHWLVGNGFARSHRDRSGSWSIAITQAGIEAYVKHCTAQLELFAAR